MHFLHSKNKQYSFNKSIDFSKTISSLDLDLMTLSILLLSRLRHFCAPCLKPYAKFVVLFPNFYANGVACSFIQLRTPPLLNMECRKKLQTK